MSTHLLTLYVVTNDQVALGSMVFIVTTVTGKNAAKGERIAACLFEVRLLQEPAPFVKEYVFVSRQLGNDYTSNLYDVPIDKKNAEMSILQQPVSSLGISDYGDGMFVDVALLGDEDSTYSVVYAVKASSSFGFLSLFKGNHDVDGIVGDSMGMALLVECCHPDKKFRMAFTGAVEYKDHETKDMSIGDFARKVDLCYAVGCPLVFALRDTYKTIREDFDPKVNIVLPDDLVTNRNFETSNYNIYGADSLAEAVLAALMIKETDPYENWIRDLPEIGMRRVGSKMTRIYNYAYPNSYSMAVFSPNDDTLSVVDRPTVDRPIVDQPMNILRRGVKRMREVIGASGNFVQPFLAYS